MNSEQAKPGIQSNYAAAKPLVIRPEGLQPPELPLPSINAAHHIAPIHQPAFPKAYQEHPRDTPGILEQEWVDKAKEIVEKTKGNPFAEAQEVGKLKADYLKTFHSKDINTPDSI